MEDKDYADALEIQRRNFEKQFGTLEEMGFEDKSKTDEIPTDSSDEDNSNEEFGGFDSNDSENEDDLDLERKIEVSNPKQKKAQAKVVKISDFGAASAPLVSKKDRKLLRDGRIPTIAEMEKKEQLASKLTKKQQEKAIKEDDDNLENDLKLQRLLQESHILANNLEYSGVDVTLDTLDFDAPTGKARKRTLDSRLRTISAINSSTGGQPSKLEKMPMSMRKGMNKSRYLKVAKYEEEARNAGIILSKVKKGELRDISSGKGTTLASDRLGTGKSKVKKNRDKGLKIHSVGRSTRNGLVISQSEIDRINGKGGNKKRRR